jgi:hypothetical protein
MIIMAAIMIAVNDSLRAKNPDPTSIAGTIIMIRIASKTNAFNTASPGRSLANAIAATGRSVLRVLRISMASNYFWGVTIIFIIAGEAVVRLLTFIVVLFCDGGGFT